MSASDRTQYKQALVGSVGSSRTVSNAPLMVAQDAQRFESVGFPTGIANNVNVNAQVLRVDRPVQVKEARILPSAALTQDTGNLTLSYGYTNDGGGAFTTMGSINSNTSANGGTGNWAAYQSIVITANTAVNAIVPSGSHFGFKIVNAGAGLAIPSGSALQVLWEEV
jgi:hypothetical protein